MKTYDNIRPLSLVQSYKESGMAYKLSKILLKHGAVPTCSFDELVMKNIDSNDKNKKLQDEIERLKSKIKSLETHIECMPDGPLYLEAIEHFESIKNA